MKAHYGLFLKQSRQLAGLSVQELAYEAGCHESVVIAAEENRRAIPGEHVIAYANAIGLNFETIVFLWLKQVADKIVPPGHPGLSFTQAPSDTDYQLSVANPAASFPPAFR